VRPIPFRHRVLLAVLLLGALPSAVLMAGWAWTLLRFNPARASQIALEPVRSSALGLLRALDTTRMSRAEQQALHAHVDSLNVALTRSHQAFAFGRYRTVAVAIVVVMLGALIIYVSVLLARTLSLQLARPIDELIGWTARIRTDQPLPMERDRKGAPEFASLRTALREMADFLQQARSSELERERLRAFREVARRVAHEMKNPLTPVRFAIRSLERTAPPEQLEAIDVLKVETARLELLARDFANLGRLPEGPPAEVDLGELVRELIRSSVPDQMTATVTEHPGTLHVLGHYEPLRRAFANLIRNATEASGGQGTLDIAVTPDGDSVGVAIADHGPGVPLEKRARIFEPYFTDKTEGTGLGLAIVKQAVDFHHGTIEVSETAGGGATFTVRLPRNPETMPTPGIRSPLIERRVADRRRRTE
jgi:two-component system nitrogen regulation sensor histidine kinase NtrY